MKNIAISDSAVWCFRPDYVKYTVHPLQIHGDTLYAVGDFSANGKALQSANLLEIGKLGNFHAIKPDFPAKSPGA